MRIDNLSIDQLLELNQYICQRIDELQEQETLQALSQLRVGLKVTFEIREGLVLGDGGWKQYKVSLDLLRPLRDFCSVFQVYARFKVEVSNKRGA